MTGRRAAMGLLLTAAALGAGYTGYRLRFAPSAQMLPMAPARKGDFQVLVRCRGEVKARRSRQVAAPQNVPDLRIVWQAPAGTVVKVGDPVLRFDPSTAQRQLKEQEAALAQAQATLDQALAQARITVEQDRIDLAGQTNDVERAVLAVRKAEIESRLKAEESQVDLSMAERKKKVQEAKGNLNLASDAAKIASLTRQRDKAKDDVELSRTRLSQMEVSAPITGMIQYMPNYSQGWMNARPFKVGDQVWPGATVAELPDLESLEVEAKVEEIDRGKIALEQEVRVKVDSLQEVTLTGKLSALSPMTMMSYEWPPVRTFRAVARLDKIDARLRPAMNGQVDVIVNRIQNAISIPSKAVFTKAGKPVVYLPSPKGYVAREVEILARNPDEVAVKGIDAGVQVALVEPDAGKGKKS